MAEEYKIPEEIISRAASAAESINKGISFLGQLSQRSIPAEWLHGFIDVSLSYPGMADARCATRNCKSVFAFVFPENILTTLKKGTWMHDENLKVSESRALYEAMGQCLSRLESVEWAMHKNLPVCADCAKDISAEVTGLFSEESFSEDYFRYAHVAGEIYPLAGRREYRKNMKAALFLMTTVRYREERLNIPGKTAAETAVWKCSEGGGVSVFH